MFTLQEQVISPLPNPQPGGPGDRTLSGLYPSTCSAWVALPGVQDFSRHGYIGASTRHPSSAPAPGGTSLGFRVDAIFLASGSPKTPDLAPVREVERESEEPRLRLAHPRCRSEIVVWTQTRFWPRGDSISFPVVSLLVSCVSFNCLPALMRCLISEMFAQLNTI